jgi:hypothetical protein
MGQSNVGIRLSIDAAQAKGQVEDLSRVIADLNKQMKEAAEAKDWKSVAQLSQAIDNASSGRGTLMAQANQAQAQQAQIQSKDNLFGGTGAWILQQSLNQITHGILSAWDAALSAAKQRASGDYTGAAVTQRRARGEIVGQGVGTAVGALGFLGGPMLGMLLMGLGGEIGKFIGGIGSKKMEEALAWSSAYKSALPSIDLLNQLYGGAINRNSAETNDRQGLSMHERAMGAARGTGLDTDDFIQAMRQMGNYGITDATQAMNMTRNQALWSRFTGADLGTIQKVAGQARRYGGEDNAISVAYGGLRAQDMGKGQFTEFLNSMERILEDGISKGFIRSTEEIAGNMAMLYRLSGGSPLWQGEQGAQRLNQMNTSISSATNLQSVEDAISYSVVRDLLGRDNPETAVNEREGRFLSLTGGNILNGNANFRAAAEGGDNVIGTVRQGQRMEIIGTEGDYYKVNNGDREGYVHKTMFNTNGNVYTGTYADNMQLFERGVSADILQGQWAAVRQLDGNNDAAIIERFKNMYDLNYTGASQVWAMMRDSKDWTEQDWKKAERDIKRFQETPEYQSDSQKLQDILNSIKNDGIKIGKIEFDQTELPAIKQAAQEIEGLLRRRWEDSIYETSYPSQVIQPLPLPGGNPIDLQPVMAEELYRPRGFWESLDYTVPTRYFLENDQQSRAYIDAAAGEMGRSVNDIVDWVIGGGNPIRFDSNFQTFLDTAMDASNRNAGVIDKDEYIQVIRDLVDSLKKYGVSTTRLVETNEKLILEGVPIHGEIEAY